MLTPVLSRSDVARHLQALHLLPALREALAAAPAVPPAAAPAPAAPRPGSAGARVRLGTFPGIPASCATVEPSPGGGPALLQLHDLASGALLAVMDAGHLRTLSASVLGALAADALARPDAARVAVLGVGPQASSALKALRLVRSVGEVRLHGPDGAAAFELSRRLHAEAAMSVRAVDSAEEAVAGADLVLLAGEVALTGDALRPGAHVTVLGAERFERAPLPAAALARALRVGDEPGGPAPWALPLHAELGAVLAGRAPGRAGADQLTVFASTAPAFLDLVAAWHVYQGAREDDRLTRLDLSR